MSFSTDNGGLAVRAEIKVSAHCASTWKTRLSQGMRNAEEVILCSFSLPNDLEYLTRIFDKHSHGVTLLVNAKFGVQARMLKRMYPQLKIMLAKDTHAKMALLSPQTVWLSSENLVPSPNFENTVGIHNREVYQYFRQQILSFLQRSEAVEVREVTECCPHP